MTEVVCDHAPAKVTRLGMHDTFGETATLDYLKAKYGINVAAIIKAIRKERE